MKNINKFSLFLILALVFVGSFAEYKIALASTGGGTATIAVDNGTPSSGVTVIRGTSHTFTIVLTIPTGGMTLGATSPTFTIPDGFTAPNNHAVATIGEVNTDGMWSATTTGAGCTVSSDPASITSSSTGQIITIDIIGNCAVNDTISLIYKGTSNVAMGATRLVVSTVIAGDTSPVEALNVAPYSPTITVTDTANIVVASAKITSSSTVLVTFVNPGQNLASVDFTRWHIDQNDNGNAILNPSSATITSTGTPWTITLNFDNSPFASTSKSYDAAHGLYAQVSGVTDTNGDTNVVVTDTLSTAITDGQAPTLVSAIATSDTNVQLTFSEPITVFHATDFKIDIPEYTGNGDQGRGTFASRDGSDNTKVNVTVISLNNTAYTSTNLDILVDAVKDLSPATNGILEDLNRNILDGQAPIISNTAPVNSALVGASFSSEYTLSEAVADGSITFSRTGGTSDGVTHNYDFLSLDRSSGAHQISRTVLESIFGSLVNGSIYSITYHAIDAAGNTATTTTNTGVLYNSAAPTVIITNDSTNNIVKSGDAVVITTTFNEDMMSAPTISIDVSTGSDADVISMGLSSTTDPKVYIYDWTVPSGHNGDTAVVTVAGEDLAGNPYVGLTHDDFVIRTTPRGRSAVTDYSTTTLSESATSTGINFVSTPATSTLTISTSSATTSGNTILVINKILPYQFLFTKILKLSSVGDEVRQLQIFLNTHGFTVSKIGNGSAGKETAYFGQKTKDALIKFQEANAKDILIPQDLIKGTGIFLNYSKKLINQILLSGN